MRLGHRRTPGRRPSRRERGAILVELSIVGLFLVTLLAGAFDYGMAWRSGLAVTEGVRAGARVGSSSGNDRNADLDLLLSTQAALKSSGMIDSVQRVVIFRSPDNGQVPASCKTSTGQVDGCNILTGPQLKALLTTTVLRTDGCVEAWSSKGFCPTTRNDIPATADSVGIWIRAQHPFLFRLLGTSQNIERTAVMRIEPRQSNPSGSTP